MAIMTTRLLLIDDHTLFRSGIGMVLGASMKSVEIFEAASLEQALQCPSDVIELVLLDVQLDGLNGLDGIALLKRKWPSAKVLVVSASQDTRVMQTALAKGAQGFISKSETPTQMLEVVAQLLAGEASFTGPDRAQAHAADGSVRLTPRQCEVLDLVCQGLPNKTIGRRLNLSENTVRGHVQALLAALQVSSRSEAAFMARQLGLVN